MAPLQGVVSMEGGGAVAPGNIQVRDSLSLLCYGGVMLSCGGGSLMMRLFSKFFSRCSLSPDQNAVLHIATLLGTYITSSSS